MPDECLICSAPLEYLNEETEMECCLCHRKAVCDDCHRQGVDGIVHVCLAETGRDPIALMEKMMSLPFCHMHGPEHHIMVGAALLTAFRNAGGNLDLERALGEMISRGREVPGGICGFWGSCGAGVSAGIFLSIATGSTPLAGEVFGLANRMTAKSLEAIGEVGGPRCCKRDSYLSLLAAIRFVKENLGVEMESHTPVCSRSAQNAQCIGKRCPFSPANHRKAEESAPSASS